MSSSQEIQLADFHSLARVSNTLLQFINSMSLKCAVELGIPDAIRSHGGPMPVPVLAAAVALPPAKTPSLSRLLLLLGHNGFFDRAVDASGEECYALTPLSNCLLDGGSELVKGILHPAMVTPWLHLTSWFRSIDEPTPFTFANGTSLFGFAGRNPEFNALFNAAMATDSKFVTAEIVQRCGDVFEGVQSIVDVGGGNGTVARALAAGFPHLKCTVLDLAHVVTLQEPSERVEFVQGNMFEHIPPADAVFLKSVLHDLDDKTCLDILRRSKEAVSSGEKQGKVIVVDIVVDVANESHYRSQETHLFMDLQMMAITGGKERVEGEWRKIFDEAGFASYKITPLASLCLIEAYP